MTGNMHKAMHKGRSAQKSKQSSKQASRTASKAGTPRYYGSDNEQDDAASATHSDDTGSFLASPPSGLSDSEGPRWEEKLEDSIVSLGERKSTQRADLLKSFIAIVASKVGSDIVEKRHDELLENLSRIVRTDHSSADSQLALAALNLVVLVAPQDEDFETVKKLLKSQIYDNSNPTTKQAAVRSLGCATFYGGADLEETASVMEFLMEIIESDGMAVAAEDDGGVVSAAIQEWGFLFTQLREQDEIGKLSIAAFVEQLDSSDNQVIIAAGKAIAMIYEAAYWHHWESGDSGDIDNEDDHRAAYECFNPPYPRHSALLAKLKSLINDSGRYISKGSKIAKKFEMRDVLQGIEIPWHGCRYQDFQNGGRRDALDRSTHQHNIGHSKLKLHLNQKYTIENELGELTVGHDREAIPLVIDTWDKLIRYDALRTYLKGGFQMHWKENTTVNSTLPMSNLRRLRFEL